MGFLSGLFQSNTSRIEIRPTTHATAERIRNILGIRQLESMPVQAAKAFQLASDVNAKQTDFIDVIESDEVLSARVIRIANSVYFSRGTAATDIEKAVANIGLDELRCLLSASMLRSLLTVRHATRDIIWANAVATGILCRIVARSTRNLNPGEAFLCGLLHDVGKLVMIRKGGSQYDKVIALAGSGERPFPEAEEKVFELDHIEVGKWVAESWNFPESVLRSVALHHEGWPAGNEPIELTYELATKFCDLIAHSIGIGHSLSMRGLAKAATEERDRIAPRLGFSESSLKGVIAELEAKYEKESALYQPEGA